MLSRDEPLIQNGVMTPASPPTSEVFPQSADWFRLLFERSTEAMTLLDPQTHLFVAHNAASMRAIGVTADTPVTGLTPVMIAPEFQPCGRSSQDFMLEAFALTLERGSYRFEWQLKRVDGTLAYCDIVATSLQMGDRPLILTAARNIDDLKKTEDDLRLSESRWRRVFEQAPMSLQIFNPEGSTLQINRAFEKLFRLILPDLEHFNIRQDQQLAAAGFMEHIERAFSGGVSHIPPIPFELKATPDQPARGLKWIGSTMFPVLDAQGKIVEVVCVHEDDTARKLAEDEVRLLTQSLEERIEERTAKLRLSEERFKQLFELSPLGMARVSWDGRFQQVNQAFARMLGYEIEEVVKLTYWDITPPEYAAQEEEILQSVKTTGKFGPFEKAYFHRDGHRIPIVLNGMHIQGSDGSDEIWGITQDVTERYRAEQALRESERKFRVLFETSSQGVILHDEHQLFNDVNQAAANIFGLTPAELIGKHPAEIAPEFQPDGESSMDAAKRHIATCLETGMTRFEWTQLHAQGHEVLIEVVLSKVTDENHQLVQAVVTDISERRRAEKELKRALEHERELNQLKTNFVSMVSHEFRTPLGIIQSSAEILDDYLDQLKPEERREQLQSIIKNSRRMAGLMEDVLLLGRLDAGRMDFSPGLLDLAALCRRLVDEVRFATEAKCPIEFFTTSLPTEARADERLLRHMLINLLSNAVKYSDDGASVYFHAWGAPGSVRFVIRDRGIGIPLDEQPLLFEAFRRGSNVGQRPGTGLGLVIVKRSVKLHGGDLQLESQPGQGTTFTIEIPLHADAQP